MGHGIKTPIYQVGYKFLDSDPESIIHEGKIDLLILLQILLMGLRKSGKSSIRHVVFHKMSANETLFLEGTSKIEKIDISMKCFLQFQVWLLNLPISSMPHTALSYDYIYLFQFVLYSRNIPVTSSFSNTLILTDLGLPGAGHIWDSGVWHRATF